MVSGEGLLTENRITVPIPILLPIEVTGLNPQIIKVGGRSEFYTSTPDLLRIIEFGRSLQTAERRNIVDDLGVLRETAHWLEIYIVCY